MKLFSIPLRLFRHRLINSATPRSKALPLTIPSASLPHARHSSKMASPLKRKAPSTTSPKTKKAKYDLHTWKNSARAKQPTFILPDKDADGLSSGAILHHTLTSLGLPSSLISVYFPGKGSSLFDDTTRTAISGQNPSYIFVLDQGSSSTTISRTRGAFQMERST